MVTVRDDDYLYFVERAVRGMANIVVELGDEQVCRRPDLPGANSAYGVLTHCLGVIEHWAGQVNLGRDIERDRDAEFAATGTVAELLARVERVLAQFAPDVAATRSDELPASPPATWAERPEVRRSQGRVLLHLYEEVAQHHGQLEILRDVLLAAGPHVDALDPPLDWLRGKRTIKWHGPGPDLIPAWVADMDFPIAPPIRAALVAMLDRGDLGYPNWPPHPLASAFADRMIRRFGWAADPAHVRPVTDVIQGLQIALELGTEPGDAVLAHRPNYPPFPATMASMGRRLVPVPLAADGESWTWDQAALERDAHGATVLLVVNPHNPTGRSFTRAELQRLAAVAEANDLLVICDEIHAELTHDPHEHVPFASLSPETAARTVTITSATKAYNIAGVCTAVAHVGPAWLRDKWDAQPPELFGQPSTLGVEATVAAWRDCDEWLAELRGHLRAQRDHLAERVAALPGVSMQPPDAGYLAWLDCRAAALPDDPAAYFRAHAGLELAPGPDYDPAAEGWVRLNFATSRVILDEILDRMNAALINRSNQ